MTINELNLTNFARDVAGALTVTNGAAGGFTWAYALADVADAGECHGAIYGGICGKPHAGAYN